MSTNPRPSYAGYADVNSLAAIRAAFDAPLEENERSQPKVQHPAYPNPPQSKYPPIVEWIEDAPDTVSRSWADVLARPWMTWVIWGAAVLVALFLGWCGVVLVADYFGYAIWIPLPDWAFQ